MTDTISKRIANMRWRRLAVALVGLLLMLGGTLSWAQGDVPSDAVNAVEAAARDAALTHQTRLELDTAMGSALSRRGVLISNTQVDGPKAFGAIVYPVPDGEKGMPYAMFYVAHQVNGAWQVATEYTPMFYTLLADLPATLIGAEHKALLLSGSVLDNVQGNETLRLNFPFPVGETWAMTGGPHNRLGHNARPWGATDWNRQGGGGGHSIRSARDGVATVTCKNFIRIDHGGGVQTTYYHVANITISNGQRVGRHQHLGGTSEQSGCGGSGFGPHVHFAPLLNGGEVNINGHDIGGWTILEGANQYEGCIRRVSTGETRCGDNAVVKNEGHIGSGVSATAPADTNLIKNSDFSDGINHWAGYGSHTGWAVYESSGNNFLAWKGETGGTLAAIRQEVPNSVPPGSTMELRLLLGNSSNVTKVVRAHIVRYIGDGPGHNWRHMAVCDFSIPPQTPLQHYIVREYTTDTWEQIGVWIENKQMDSVPDILMDDVSVYRYPKLVLTEDQCFAPSSNVNWNMAAPLGLQGWTLRNDLRDVKVTKNGEGVWMKIVDENPILLGPSLVNVQAEDYPTLHVRMTSTTDKCGQIYFMNPGRAAHEDQSVKFEINPDNRPHDYFIDLSNHPSYVGSIAQIRLDPGGGSCGYNASLSNAIAITEIHLLRNNLVNTSFETAGAGSRFADKWTHNKPEADRRLCQDGIAHTGQCAYRFQPGTRPGQVVQRINSPDGRAGDIINVAAWVRTNKAYAGGGAIILQVDYTDGTKGRLRLAVPKSLTYTQISGQLALEKPVKNMRLIMQRAATMRGMFLVDDVNVAIARLNRSTSNGVGSSPDDGGLVPLPAAPTEGQELRGN